MTLTNTFGDLWSKPRRRYVRNYADSHTRHGWASTVSVVHPFAVNEGRKRLARIPAGMLTQAVRDQVEEFLLHVSDAHSTVPSVVPTEDGSAVLHWVAGPTSIEVEVDTHGANYLWAAREDGSIETLSDDPAAIRNATRRLVAAMAARVNKRNPRWREQYLER